jgi:hypothetical protein
MSLTVRYAEYLRTRDPAQAEQLATALRESYPFEAGLLARYAAHGETALTLDEGVWAGSRTWVGPQPPAAEEAGQIWFDTVELVAMVLVPREPAGADWHPEAIARWTPFVGWLSLRPVAHWQFRAYLEVAGIAPREIETIAFTTHDPARLFGGGADGDETLPIARLTCVEALGCARWLGKQLPTQQTWQAASHWRRDAIDLLWNGLRKEWIGWPEHDEDEARALSPQTLVADAAEERELNTPPPPESRMLYRYFDWSRHFGFRTGVLAEVGLYTRDVVSPLCPR